MLARLKGAGLLWPTAFALAALAVLVGLGTWQLQRRTWKEALIAKIAARVKAEPVSLAVALRRYAEGGDVEYAHVVARGRFHHDKERYLYAPAKSGLGWHVYTPLEFAPRRIVWVNRGFVPDELKSPQSRPGGDAPDGQAGIAGIVRLPPQPGLFTPQNDPARNLWYWPDAAAMTASAFAAQPVETAPVTIDADASPDPGARPRGGTTRIDLPNRHLEYALTWYGLALTLIGVYVAFAVSRLRNSSGA
jgi:surfeit locus 1 family protein